jgi:hypothetical protein
LIPGGTFGKAFESSLWPCSCRPALSSRSSAGTSAWSRPPGTSRPENNVIKPIGGRFLNQFRPWTWQIVIKCIGVRVLIGRFKSLLYVGRQ